jgi:hypothetical protein
MCLMWDAGPERLPRPCRAASRAPASQVSTSVPSGYATQYPVTPERAYPLHDWTAIVTTCGRICYEKRKVNLSTVFAGQKVGIAQVSEHIWLVSFMDYDLGYFDDETCRLEPIENPFRPESVTYVPRMNCYPCVRNGPD